MSAEGILLLPTACLCQVASPALALPRAAYAPTLPLSTHHMGTQSPATPGFKDLSKTQP